jgi:hypothetical protein
VVHVHNDQQSALVVLVGDKNHRVHTDQHRRYAYCTDHHQHDCTDRDSSLVVDDVVVAYVDVHKVNHKDEIVRPCSYYAYSDTIDRDRRHLNNYRFDSTTLLDNLDYLKLKNKLIHIFYKLTKLTEMIALALNLIHNAVIPLDDYIL